MTDHLPSPGRPPYRTMSPQAEAPHDAKDLIRLSTLLRHRSMVVQRAATSATIRLEDLLRRSTDLCKK